MANISDIGSAGSGQPNTPAKPLKKGSENGFDSVINDAMGKVSEVQNDVEKAVKELAAGGDITSAIIAVEKADMTFQLMVEFRNKLLSAYEEIMRMQV